MSKMINIPGRLHAVTSENVVVGSNEILDETFGKKQNVINIEVGNKLVFLETELASKQKILTAGVGITITEDGTISTTVDSSVGKIIQDHNQITEPVEGVLYLEPTANTSVFTEYIYKNNSWIDLGYLELTFGLDDTPTENSTNAVKSGGIKRYVDNITDYQKEVYDQYPINGYWRISDPNNIIFASSNTNRATNPIPCAVGDVFNITSTILVGTAGHIYFNSNIEPIGLLQTETGATRTTFTITQEMWNNGARYVGFSFRSTDELSILKAAKLSPQEVENRLKDVENRVIEIESKINTGVTIFDEIKPIYAYAHRAPNAFRNKLLQMDKDIEILLLGDSITAYTHFASDDEEPDAANRPCGMQRNSLTWMIWNSLCNNKPQCDRYDSTINPIIEDSGNWSLSDYRKFDNVVGYSPHGNGYLGEFSKDNSVYREAADDDFIAEIHTNWNLDEYENFALIHRLGIDGTTEINVIISQSDVTNNLVEVFDETTNTWIEANSYYFSQHLEQGRGVAGGHSDWVRQKILKFRKKTNATGIVEIKFRNTGNGVMYYWGTERWNGNTVRIINAGKGGRPTSDQVKTIHDEIAYRNPDLIIYQLPVWNELKAGGNYMQTWNTYHTQIIDLIKAQSDNWNNYQMMIYIPHTQVADWDKDRNKKFQANGDITRPITDNVSMTELTREELLLSGYDLNVPILNLNSLIIDFAHSLGINMQTLLGSMSDDITDGTTAKVNVTDKYTADGVHMSKTGAKFVANCLLPMLK